MLTDPISSALFPPSAVSLLVFVSAHVSLIDFVCVPTCLSVVVWRDGGCRYFGDQIGDVFTQEDFQLYR